MFLTLDFKGFMGSAGTKAAPIVAPPDYRTNLVIEYQAGVEGNFTYGTGAAIDVEKAATGGTDFDLTSVGDGGYTTKANHDTVDALDGIKTVNSNPANNDAQSRYVSGVAGTLDAKITGTSFSVVAVLKPRTFNNVFSAPDPIFRASNNVFQLLGITGPKVRFHVGTASQSLAEASWTVGSTADCWHIVIGTYANDKARVWVDGVAGTDGATSAGLLAGNLATRLEANSNVGTGGVFDGPRELIRVYNEAISTLNQAALVSYLQFNYATLL